MTRMTFFRLLAEGDKPAALADAIAAIQAGHADDFAATYEERDRFSRAAGMTEVLNLEAG